jgi:4'-phosphopantetheinyl transferase EntD
MPVPTDLLDLLPIPPQAVLFYSSALPTEAELLPAEEPITVGMVAKRRAEFTHGRYCARSAMDRLGVAPAPILKGPDREPLWPAGLVGSISHTASLAAAVVAQENRLRSLGLDMESAEPLTDNLLDMICLAQENPNRDGRLAKLLFSIKESIYKCLHPLTHKYIDFLEMEVLLSNDGSTFGARSHSEKCAPELATIINGRYIRNAELITSIAWIDADS